MILHSMSGLVDLKVKKKKKHSDRKHEKKTKSSSRTISATKQSGCRFFDIVPTDILRIVARDWLSEPLKSILYCRLWPKFISIPTYLPTSLLAVELSKRARAAFTYCCDNGYLGILKWMYENNISEIKSVALEGYMDKAARAGHLDVMKWLREQQCFLQGCFSSSAAAGGHLEVLVWLRLNGCAFERESCENAAENGHFELLKWLRVNGCDWNKRTFAAAAKWGDLVVLQWLKDNRCPWDSYSTFNAAAAGHFKVLRWLRLEGCPWDVETLEQAVLTGNLEMINWVDKNGCSRDERVCKAAASAGHLEILKWLRLQEYSWDRDVCIVAAREGHLELLQWAQDNGCPCDPERIISSSLETKSVTVELLQWGLDNGLVLTEDLFYRASRVAKVELLFWLNAHQCPWSRIELVHRAEEKGSAAALEFLISEGYEVLPETVLNAVAHKWPSILQLLHDKQLLPLDEKYSIKAAAYGYIDMLVWLKQNGYPVHVK